MGEFAGVDPQRVRALAKQLKDLADAIATNGSIIRSNFSKWGGTLDLGHLARQAVQVGQDARDMALRADEALNLLHQPGSGIMCTPHGDWVSVPWDTKDINTTKEAQQEAADLKAALDNPKDPHARSTIAEIAQSLADHQGDSAFMTAFMISGGLADAARVAEVLHGGDGTHDGSVLSKESERILGQFGSAAQVMSSLAINGNYPRPAPDYLSALTNPPGGDMWSVGMLFKYGPSGDQWDPTVLSKVGGAMLDWRAKQLSGRSSMRPDYMPRTGSGAYYGYYTSTGVNNWYQALGLDPQFTDPGAGPGLAAAISANDPSVVLMDRVGQNPQASRDLLTQPDGAGFRHAQQLVNYHWETPGPNGPIDESDAVRRVLTLAATDRSPDHLDQSGQAADNILTAAAMEKDAFFTRDESDMKEQYQIYPKGTAIALAAITATWAKDLGATSLTAGGGHGYANHVLGSNRADLIKVMQLFAKDNPSAAAMFDSALHVQVSDAAASQNAANELTNMGNLAGLFTKAKVGISYTEAQQEDEEHKFNVAILNAAVSLFGYIPGPTAAAGETLKGAAKVVGTGLKYSQRMVSMGNSIVQQNSDMFSTNNAAKQEAHNQEEARMQYVSFNPAIAQGLIRSGQVPVPAGHSWYDAQTGSIAPSAYKDNDFNTWWSQVSVRDQALNPFQIGFDHAEGAVDGK